MKKNWKSNIDQRLEITYMQVNNIYPILLKDIQLIKSTWLYIQLLANLDSFILP